MKVRADDQNEVQNAKLHNDIGSNCITPVIRLDPTSALAVVNALSNIVRLGHKGNVATQTDGSGVQRAQRFEEGNVYLLEPPFSNFIADRYIMDFFDVDEQQICSRMHMHTGCRFVRMMTGPQTHIRVSSFSQFMCGSSPGWNGPDLKQFTDDAVLEDGTSKTRYNTIVPENSWVDMQIPGGVSHQFNAYGPNAVIDSIHPEESNETHREQMTDYKMMAQTIFLEAERVTGRECIKLRR